MMTYTDTVKWQDTSSAPHKNARNLIYYHGYVYTIRNVNAPVLVRLNAVDLTIKDTLSLTTVLYQGGILFFDSTNNKLHFVGYNANLSNNAHIIRINPDTMAIEQQVDIDAGVMSMYDPEGIAITMMGTLLYVVNAWDFILAKINPLDYTSITITAPPSSGDVEELRTVNDGTYIYMAVYDTANAAVRKFNGNLAFAAEYSLGLDTRIYDIIYYNSYIYIIYDRLVSISPKDGSPFYIEKIRASDMSYVSRAQVGVLADFDVNLRYGSLLMAGPYILCATKYSIQTINSDTLTIIESKSVILLDRYQGLAFDGVNGYVYRNREYFDVTKFLPIGGGIASTEDSLIYYDKVASTNNANGLVQTQYNGHNILHYNGFIYALRKINKPGDANDLTLVKINAATMVLDSALELPNLQINNSGLFRLDTKLHIIGEGFTPANNYGGVKIVRVNPATMAIESQSYLEKIVSYNGNNYRCLTTNINQTPDNHPASWRQITDTHNGSITAWDGAVSYWQTTILTNVSAAVLNGYLYITPISGDGILKVDPTNYSNITRIRANPLNPNLWGNGSYGIVTDGTYLYWLVMGTNSNYVSILKLNPVNMLILATYTYGTTHTEPCKLLYYNNYLYWTYTSPARTSPVYIEKVDPIGMTFVRRSEITMTFPQISWLDTPVSNMVIDDINAVIIMALSNHVVSVDPESLDLYDFSDCTKSGDYMDVVIDGVYKYLYRNYMYGFANQVFEIIKICVSQGAGGGGGIVNSGTFLPCGCHQLPEAMPSF